MSVNNRKLFANRDARRRLSEMGGIVASSPELLGVAQQFQVGGMVDPMPQIPEMIAPPRVSYYDWLGMSRAEREAAGLPVSRIGGELEYNRILAGMGLADEYGDVTLGINTGSRGRPDRRLEEPTVDVDEILFGGAGGASDPRAERNAPEPEPVILSPAEAAGAETEGTGSTPEDRELTVQELSDIVSASNNPSEDVAATILAGAGAGEGFDLGSVEGRISAYEELFARMLGESDEEKRREKYMNLAMIGFAIAAGEDPSALKNIADGLLAGTAQMAESNAARRERENRISELAIQAGIGDERALLSAAKDPVTWIETPQGEATVELYTELTTTRNLSHEDAIAALNAITPGLGDTYQSAMSVGVVRPTAPSTAITISTQEEYDALPSGSVYIDAETGRSATKP